MASFLFLIALLTLLAAPGPTNALLLAAGVTCRSVQLRFALAAMAGYLVTVSAFGFIIGPLAAQEPMLLLGLRLFAVALMVRIAWRLWFLPTPLDRIAPATGFVGPVFLTTLLNPKGMIIAFALLPEGWQSGASSAIGYLVTVLAMVTLVSLGWLWLGARAAARLDPRYANRGSALILGGFGAALAVAAVMG